MDKPDKRDFVRQDKKLYAPKQKPEIVNVPMMQYLMYDGQGTPETSPEFQPAFAALYAIAYSIKYMPRRGLMPFGYEDFKMPPVEGLWWMEGRRGFDTSQASDWRWTLMLRMPEFVTPALVEQVKRELTAKKPNDIYERVHLSPLKEGKSVQLLHVGPYESEGPDLAKMDEFAQAKGYEFVGKHHEIYFGDPRRTRPDKLRTVLRHPVVTRP